MVFAIFQNISTKNPSNFPTNDINLKPVNNFLLKKKLYMITIDKNCESSTTSHYHLSDKLINVILQLHL